ncbi:uncharacterized protein FOMMEDRAFT_164723 [Fomitiporia mediterranea MF3/22]|uniref:uncharacterized protein n=1 Tax=Fomitiporia mediterranea (strain MF3/22) TaxID=694068 RepID=UPI0004408AF1|nr:uncharacterized protein FOMMEDRAFT_164723 [Fomitiporia mediterranea MF3/22]EJD07877.1 hypothetical protein FOMMEDRAFT_164723 [Fomitiporia mediterranea MF3/22]
MKISAPRTFYSARENKTPSSSGHFRAPSSYDSDSSEEDYLSSDEGDTSYDLDISVDSADAQSDSADEDQDVEEDLIGPWNKLTISGRTPQEQHAVLETVASVRNHSRHVDPYEEWESQMRRNAFLTARRQQASVLHEMREKQRQNHLKNQQQFNFIRTKELEFLQISMEKHRNITLNAENQLRERWKERDRKLWERIELAIKEEEDKLRATQEAERQAREENERKMREMEEKTKKEEEERKKAEEEKRQKVVAEKLRRDMEETEKQEKEEKAKLDKTRVHGLLELREKSGLLSCEDMWKVGLRCLKYLRSETMRAVKGPRPPDPEPAGYQAPPPPPLKKLWSAQRRKITPKIGQLTDDPEQIARISEELKAIVAPIPNMPRPEEAQCLHHALLASFAKAVVAQAETEVTAHKAQAGPLARVAVSLISAYPALGDIFWARLCARAGCWAAGVEPEVVENEQWQTLPDKEKRKRWGAREDENLEEKMTRISGILRLYFSMMFISVTVPMKEPMPMAFRPARFWLYLSQLLDNQKMIEKPVAPEIIYVALDEGGVHAKTIWGKQFIKMLQFIYEGIQGEDKQRFGGSDVLAQASRARCILEIEKIMTQ